MSRSQGHLCSNEGLLERIRRGDSRAFETLWAAHTRDFERHAQKVTGNSEDAKDVLQKAAIRAFLNAGRCQGSFVPWVRSIILNLAIDDTRSAKRRPYQSIEDLRNQNGYLPEIKDATAEDLAEVVPDNLILEERVSALRAVLVRLRAKNAAQAMVIDLRYGEDLDYSRIAEIVGATVVNCRSLEFRGRKWLREELLRHRPEEWWTSSLSN